MENTVTAWIDTSEDWQRERLRKLREIIRTTVPDATEALKWGQPCYSLNGLFCYLQRAKTHVTLGFQKGAVLDDPEGLLEGDGKQMRHIKFGPTLSIDESQCVTLIKEAVRQDS